MLKRREANIVKILVIGVFCLLIYVSNQMTIGAGDTVPNSLLAFHWLENHTLHLDIFRDSYLCSPRFANCYFFMESNNGHLTSIYPIGTAIVTFPLYLIFYLYLKLTVYHSIPMDLTVDAFEIYRMFFEKLAAALTTVITVVIFYLSVKLKFDGRIALLSSFIFAFATNVWVISSQGLWQHTASNLILSIVIFSLLKTNRVSQGRKIKIWLIVVGVAAGLLVSIRPTNIIYTLTIVLYSIFTYRSQSIFLLLGLVSVIPSILWNLYYFGNLTGGYSQVFHTSPYQFTFSHFLEASLGIFISPSRGLIIFSPVLLYSLPGAYRVFKLRFAKDEQLIGSLTFASLILLCSYCFYIVWWGGHSYGPRLITDILPVICYLISYSIAFYFPQLGSPLKLRSLHYLIFPIVLIFSTFVQFVGTFGSRLGAAWNIVPYNIDYYHHRLWSWQDSPIERYTQAVLHKIMRPPVYHSEYLLGLDGRIEQIVNKDNQSIESILSVKANSTAILKAKLQNTGKSKWFSYKAALKQGETQVRGRFYDQYNQPISEVILFIPDSPQQYNFTYAIGSVTFPSQPGMYKLTFDLVSRGIGEFPINNQYILTVIVNP